MEHSVEIIEGTHTLSKSINKASSILRVAAYCRVSTDSQEQLNSFESQKNYYTAMINGHAGWKLAGIYADEAITGTSVDKRESFQDMINDALQGKIDLIVCKSISRFARNTVDTLQYVRLLKNHNVEIYFEEENIKTLSMDGELLLTILSSVAQQEVQNISDHVKTGLRHKMKSGQLVGYNGCLGYDYHKDTKTLTVNQEEAKIVKYIFGRYLSGAGAGTIARELMNNGYVTKRGSKKWFDTTIIGIIKNEKYTGDLIQGKTITVDAIAKRRVKNDGSSDRYLIRNHHEAIIPRKEWEAAQEILNKRSYSRSELSPQKGRTKYSREYTFSSKLWCGYCNSGLSRRTWHGNSSNYKKIVWQCMNATKNGKKYCPKSVGVQEVMIEKAFVEAFNNLFISQGAVIDEFLKNTEEALLNDSSQKNSKRLKAEIEADEKKISSLIDLLLEKKISKEEYDKKYEKLQEEISQKQEEYDFENSNNSSRDYLLSRLEGFKKTILSNKALKKFDPEVFELLVEKIIVGGYDENGVSDPYKLTFIFKTIPLKNEVINGSKYRVDRRRKPLNSDQDDDVKTLPTNDNEMTCGDSGSAHKAMIHKYQISA